MSVTVSPLAAEEIESLIALARTIWRAHYPAIIGAGQTEYMLEQRYAADVIAAELARADLWWDVLREDGALLAFASSFLEPAGDALKLDKLYVHPAYQRRGFGARLIEHTAQRAVGLGCGRLVLAVNRHNSAAIAAYLKQGFAIRNAVVKPIGAGYVMDDYIMERVLDRGHERSGHAMDPGAGGG